MATPMPPSSGPARRSPHRRSWRRCLPRAGRRRRAAIDCSARCSWRHPSVALRMTIARMTAASRRSPRNSERAAAAKSTRVRTPVSWPSKICQRLRPSRSETSLGPYRSKRRMGARQWPCPIQARRPRARCAPREKARVPARRWRARSDLGEPHDKHGAGSARQDRFRDAPESQPGQPGASPGPDHYKFGGSAACRMPAWGDPASTSTA